MIVLIGAASELGGTMARVTSFEQVTAERDSVHRPVSCGWRVVSVSGVRLLQLDTYGSEDRENPGKLSQSLQLDETAAVALMVVIRRAFPGL